MFVRTYRHAYVATFEDEGAVGLVLSRPTQADLLDHLPGWWSVAVNPRVVFVGGSVWPGGFGVFGGVAGDLVDSGG